ncbi:MAG: YciI family protein [Candidatus Thorarchaeota archaeon]
METQSFVIMLRPAPNYGSPQTEEIVSKHFNYLKSLIEEGKLIMAGRFSEVLIGLVMIEAESREEALKLMENDPAVQAGVFNAELYPWSIALRAD